MIVIDKGSDFEFYSSTSKGAIQAYGYVFHAGTLYRSSTRPLLTLWADKKYGARILRLNSVKDFSVHDIALVDGKHSHHSLVFNLMWQSQHLHSMLC